MGQCSGQQALVGEIVLKLPFKLANLFCLRGFGQNLFLRGRDRLKNSFETRCLKPAPELPQSGGTIR